MPYRCVLAWDTGAVPIVKIDHSDWGLNTQYVFRENVLLNDE